MSEQIVTVTSSLPAAAFLVPLAAGALIFLGRRLRRAFWQGTALLASGITCPRSALRMAWPGARRRRAHRVGRTSCGWTRSRAAHGRRDRRRGIPRHALLGALRDASPACCTRAGAEADGPQAADRSTALLLWFLGTMVWGCVTNNIIMLYVAVEATTLTSGLLVAFYWDRRALEAGYKYLMLLTIGITFALFGCVLLYAAAAATGQLRGSEGAADQRGQARGPPDPRRAPRC